MSGLLPRTSGPSSDGNFTNLTANSLVVNGTGFISNLATAVFSAGQLETTDLSSATDLTISTGGSERLIIPQAGILNDNTAIDVLALNGTDELVYVNDLVDLTGAQTLTNKTLTAPIIATISNTGTITLPTSTTTLVGRNTTDTLTNKTIDSATNTLTITSSPLSGQNINNVLNQAVRTGSAVTFGTVTTQSLLLSTAVNDAVTVRSSTTQNNQILFQSSTPTDQTGFGYDVLNSLHRVWGYLNSAMVFATNNLERIRIAAGGIASDPTITNMLGLNGTTLSYKTINIDQDVRTTASPTFSALNLTNGVSVFGGNVYEVCGTQVVNGAGVTNVYTLPTVSSKSYLIEYKLWGFVTSGINAGDGFYQNSISGAANNAGVITLNTVFGNQFALNGVSTGVSVTSSGTNVLLGINGSALDNLNTRWYIRVFIL